MIRFCCSGCSSGIEVPEDRAGKIIYCPQCGRPTHVPTFLPIEPGTDPGVPAVPPLITGSNSPSRGVRFSKKRILSVLAFPVYRFGSPATLLLALLLFPLPWVRVQCDRPIGNSETRTLVEQSGLQMVYGGYSENPLLRNAEFAHQRTAAQERLSSKDNALPGSRWMVLYAFLLVCGILAGLLVWSNPLRSALLIGSSASAGLVLFIQAYMGFPLERALPNTVAKRLSLGETVGIEISAATLLETRYTGWFWLTVVAVLGSLAAACTESWIVRANPSRQH